MTSGDLIPSDRDRPEQASLEVEFALVVARMIDSLKDNPEDMRQAIYELARYKLQEQLPNVTDKEKQRTQQALETAIRGVEAFKEQNADIPAPARRLQLGSPRAASAAADPFDSELNYQARPRSHSHMDAERDADGSKHANTLWSRLRRTAAMIAIIVAILVAVQQRERLLSLAHIAPKPEQNTTIATIADRIAP